MIGQLVSAVGLLLIVVTLVAAERRGKRRDKQLCDEADRQLEALMQHAQARLEERAGHEPRPGDGPRPTGPC